MATHESTQSSDRELRSIGSYTHITEGVTLYLGDDNISIRKCKLLSGEVLYYEVEGVLSALIEVGLLNEDQIPVGSKRTGTVEYGGVERGWCRIKRSSAKAGVLQFRNPPESIVNLCELLMKGIVMPPTILGMAWSACGVEGPRRTAEKAGA